MFKLNLYKSFFRVCKIKKIPPKKSNLLISNLNLKESKNEFNNF